LLGLAATSLFASSLVFFAAAHPGYEHGTKAVSELGAAGAPNALPWNLIGFLLPGVLLALFGLGVGASARDRRAGVYLALSGMAFAATAVPADMSNLRSPLSLGHIAASLLVFAFWLPAALRLLKPPAAGLRRATMIFLLLAIVAAAIRFTPLLLPGWGQRLSFLAYFGWVCTVSLLLLRPKPALAQVRDRH
jgi:hypothetical membrane protein